MQIIGNMVITVPPQFLEGDYLKAEFAHDPTPVGCV
jgi:hypothetical protein